MNAAQWTPEQWSALIVLASGQLAVIIKLVLGDRTTKTTAETLATKVETNTETVKGTHDTLASKVDNVLDTVKHQAARLDGSIRIRQVLSDRVDNVTGQVANHEQRITTIENNPILKGE